MLDITKINHERKVDYFNAEKLDVMRTYYVDNYLLKFNPSIGRWTIRLHGKEIINDSHRDFRALVDCFEWQFFAVQDTVEIEDNVERADEEARRLSENLSTGLYDYLFTEAEQAQALTVAYKEHGYYTDFHEIERTRDYELGDDYF